LRQASRTPRASTSVHCPCAIVASGRHDRRGWLRQILHAGVGAADELWVVVPRGGKRLLTRGGAFSYYEFGHPERLSDRDFMELLEGPKPPARPDWARPVAAAPGKKKAKSRD